MSDDPAGIDRELESLHGSIERVTFHSEESGFCVLRVQARGHRDLVTVVGSAPAVAPGEYVEGVGTWVRDPTHGLQFRARELRIVPPSTVQGIEKYLASGMVRGIGPHFAKRLVAAFGERVFDVIERDPGRLLELPGIGPKRMRGVVEAWREQRAIRDIMVFLQSHGVGTARAVRIYKTYGDDAVALVTENPYRLALEVHGIGFRMADTLAGRLGVAPDSPLRAQAGVRHALQELADEGHCASVRDDLVRLAAELLEVPEDIADRAVADEIREGRIVEESVEGERWEFLAPLHSAERGVAGSLRRLLRGAPPWGSIAIDRAIAWVEERTGLRLAPSQRDAAALALGSKVVVVTGGPGVGKTTLLDSLLRIVRAKRTTVTLCAPTGRAAKRLAEATGSDGARTIHRLLEFDPRAGGFRRGRDHPLATDLVVLDEASMVDVVLMNQLLRAIPDHAALWIVGDADQIPSVGPGAVLGDVLRSGSVPTIRLTEIFRQAAASRIVVNAHRINRGEMPLENEGEDSDFYFVAGETPEEIAAKLYEVVTERIPRRFALDPVRDVQVLTPMNRGTLGTRALNAELQARLNPDSEPRVSRFGFTYAPGDKVIQTVNDYDKDVFNGDIGAVSRIDPDEGAMTVRYDRGEVVYDLAELDELALAYATTIHKAQGSEYPAVVLALSTQHYTMLDRNLLYTAVTRGKRLVVILGQRRALGLAVRNVRAGRRMTRLAARLADPREEEVDR